MANKALPGNEPCRAVTADEIAQYDKHGWAKLPGFLGPEMLAGLCAMAKARLGEDGTGNAVNAMTQPFFNPELTDGPKDPLLRPLLDALGRNATALMQRRPGVGTRYFSDLFAPKLPYGKPTSHPGAGETFFHQDFMNWGLDRSGGMTFWIALEDLAPESGTMEYLSGSHRMGALGNYRTLGPGGIFHDFPELLERCPNSGPVAYAAGDATVHHSMMVHGAGRNLTDRPRWAYLAVVNPSDARWTGAPPEAFSTEGLKLLGELDDERFPLLG